MKWGVRRYQNPDGTLTDKGRKHYEKIAGNKRAVDSKAGIAVSAGLAGGAQLATPLLMKRYGINPTKNDWKSAAIRAGIFGVGMAGMQTVAYSGKKRAKEILAKDNELKGITEESEKKKEPIKLTKNQKTAIKVGAAAVATGLAVYGGYKVSKHLNTNTDFRLKPSDLEVWESPLNGPEIVSKRTGRTISGEELEKILSKHKL